MAFVPRAKLNTSDYSFYPLFLRFMSCWKY